MPPLPTERLVVGLPGRVVFGLLVFAAIAFFVYSVSRRIRVLVAGRPDNRFTRIPERIGKTLEYAFAQKRMFRDLYAGFFHILIFGGFVVLTVRSLALVVEGLIPGFVLLPGRAGNAYTFVKDVFEVLTLVGRAPRGLPARFRAPEAPRPDLGRVAHPLPDRPAHGDGPRRRGCAHGPGAVPRHALGAGRLGHRRRPRRGCPGDASRRSTNGAGGCTWSTCSSSATTCRTRSTSTSSRRSRTSSS